MGQSIGRSVYNVSIWRFECGVCVRASSVCRIGRTGRNGIGLATTGMVKEVGSRLRELIPAARSSQDAESRNLGLAFFTNPVLGPWSE